MYNVHKVYWDNKTEQQAQPQPGNPTPRNPWGRYPEEIPEHTPATTGQMLALAGMALLLGASTVLWWQDKQARLQHK